MKCVISESAIITGFLRIGFNIYDNHSQMQICLYMPKNSYRRVSDAVFRFFRFLFCCDLLDFFCTDGIISTVDAYLVCKAVISKSLFKILLNEVQ